MIGSPFLGHDPILKMIGSPVLGHDPNLKMIGSGDPVDRSLAKILKQVSGHEKNFITKFQYYLFEIFLKIKKF